MIARGHAIDTARGRRLWLRAGLVLLAGGAAMTGCWAALAPQAFYAGFPGGGHTWVAVLPPYNEHLVRDVGGLYLGFTVLLVWAAVTLQRQLVCAALLAWLASALPHTVFHLGHLGGYAPGDALAQTAVLALTVLLPVALLISVGHARETDRR